MELSSAKFQAISAFNAFRHCEGEAAFSREAFADAVAESSTALS